MSKFWKWLIPRDTKNLQLLRRQFEKDQGIIMVQAMTIQELKDELNEHGKAYCDSCRTFWQLPDPKTQTGSSCCPECGPDE